MGKTAKILLFLSLITFISFAEEEMPESINADTLQGLTSSAFVSTNDFETLKVAIERLKSNAEVCADGIVDLQLGLSTLSQDERLIREKDLNKILEDYAKISSELASISSADTPGDRANYPYALQSDLLALEAELLALQTYVQTYLGHIRAENETWYFSSAGGLSGTNDSLLASASATQYTLLAGQSFRTKADSVITSVKIKLPQGTQPDHDKVFIAPYNSTLYTNSFTYSTALSTNEAPVYTYYFSDFHTTALTPYLFGLRTTNNIPVSVYRSSNAYVDSFGFLCYGSYNRYNANLGVYAMTTESQYDLCFDIGFKSSTNIVIGSEGIELKNSANLRIDGKRVATAQEVNASIAESSQSIYHSLSNHVFGSNSIANGSITAEKIASNAVTTDKIQNSAIEAAKIADGAITTSKLATNAVTTAKIQSNAITTSKIADGAITESKLLDNAVTTIKINDNAISTVKISDNAVTTAKVAAGAITDSKLSDNAVTTAKISDNSVSAPKIVSGAITESKLANNAVTADKINNSAVSTGKIADGAITESKLSDNSVSTAKINDNAIVNSKIASNAVIESKIANNAITGNKIQSNSIISSHISAQAVTSDKVANNAIQLPHFSETLKSNLVLSSGGTVTGKLEVTQLRIINTGNWHIGTTTNRCDIIINHPNGYITSLSGDLNLAAGSGRKIRAQNFVEFDHPEQCGKTTILEGASFSVISTNLSSNSIISVTPLQDPGARYWVNINTSGQATVNISGTAAYNLEFFYIIMKK